MKALLPIIDKNGKEPYYLQLYNYIKSSILRGETAEGEKLPSLRNLSKSTGLSLTTIEQAYNQLLVEGYISSKAQSGYYVNKVFSHLPRSVPSENPFPDSNLIFASSQPQKAEPSMQYDPDCFDFNKWKKCMNKILTEFSPALFFEGDPQGEEVLRMEIAKYLYMSRGVSCAPNQIVIGAGTQQITGHLATLLRKQGIEHVALETPVYMPVRHTFRDRGFAITDVPAAEDGIIIEKLPANISTAAYVSPSSNAFTGSVMPAGRRYELLNWAASNNSYIIEDDYNSELRYFGNPIPALKSLEHSQRVIYLGSFSSTLFAAVRISYMVLPPEMAESFSEIASDYSQTCSKLEQLTLALFMETGHYQTHIKKLRKLYAQKLSAFVDSLNERSSDFVTIANKTSGINLSVKVRSNKTLTQLKKDAEAVGIPSVFIHGDDSLILYYNQIPLHGIDDTVSELIRLWRS